MQQINSAVALVQAAAKSATPIKQERTHEKPWKTSTEAMVILLFARLGDLFERKAADRGLVVYSDRNKRIYSEKLKLWCRKLDDLSADDFKRGMDGLEKKAEEQYKLGSEMWPPSYAEFRALAFPKHGRDSQAHKYFPPVPALEDQTAKAKRYELGRRESAKLLAIFGDEPPKPVHSTEFAAQQLEKAKSLLAGRQI